MTLIHNADEIEDTGNENIFFQYFYRIAIPTCDFKQWITNIKCEK